MINDGVVNDDDDDDDDWGGDDTQWIRLSSQ